MITISKAKFEEIRKYVRDEAAFKHNFVVAPFGMARTLQEYCRALIKEIEARGVEGAL